MLFSRRMLTITTATALLALSAAIGLSELPPLATESRSELSGVLVEVTRGPIVESRHYGRLVAVTPEGEVVQAVGDPEALVLSRSALKPLQALATVKLALDQGIELSSEEIAVMCASHRAQEYHLNAVSNVLARAEVSESDLHCGVVRGSRLNHNCSGKHSAMLLQTKLTGASPEGYWKTDHLVQQNIRRAIQEFTGYEQPLQSGTDGCGVPNYALPLYSVALGFARLANPESAPEEYRAAAAAVRDAILAHPGHVSIHDSFHARLVEEGGGRIIGKTGAEACYGMGIANPALGVAIKIEDGNNRGMEALLLATLDRLEAMTPEIDQALGDQRTTPIRNSRDAVVGEIRAADW